MAQAAPFLMFQGGVAQEAIRFYLDVLPGSELEALELYGPDGPGPEGTVFRGTAVLAGMPVRFFDSFVDHDFGFTPSLSLFVDVDEPGQVDELAEALTEGGAFLMPVGDYGFSKRFCWVADRYGVTWQLNLAG
jgi:predicted 3-demethylubiquinone-9 3-methyltransferase (glyoxalase superfamily)